MVHTRYDKSSEQNCDDRFDKFADIAEQNCDHGVRSSSWAAGKRRAECAESYLTYSDDPALTTVLTYLENHPESNCSNSELAALASVSERTLTRRSREELGMSLHEWRQRLRTVRAISLLEKGQTVESVALDLGYSSASAFIAMFRRQTGSTPGQFGQS